MIDWDISTLRALDRKYADAGVPPHNRPIRAARDILGEGFSLNNSEVLNVMTAYEQMFPEAGMTWPGRGVGLAASVDQVRKITMLDGYGRPVFEVWNALGFRDERDWWEWCRADHRIAAEAHFAFADLFDLTYGLDDLRFEIGKELIYWQMALSNLSDVSNILPSTATVESVLQPICMVAELSLKAALVRNGENPNNLMGKKGHQVQMLARRLESEKPHRDDELITEVVSRLPDYVESRYFPSGMKRLDVVRLALGVQFVAASTVRRFGDRDMAAQVTIGDWPGPRRSLFPSKFVGG